MRPRNDRDGAAASQRRDLSDSHLWSCKSLRLISNKLRAD